MKTNEKETRQKVVPALRFPEFQNAGEWKSYAIAEFFSRLTLRNNENNDNILTISAQYGLVSQKEYFNKLVAAENTSNYFLLHKGDFAYNKSSSQAYPQGVIKCLKLYDKGIVSPLYICLKIKDMDEIPFFEQFFEAGMINSEIKNIVQEGARNHGLLNVGVKDFFNQVSLIIPKHFEERKKIAACLSSVDDLITAQTDRLKALKNHKKGLMQQLFPAEGKTVPALRFPEFQNAGEWTITTLNNLASRIIKKNNRHICRVLTNSAADGVVEQTDYFDRNIVSEKNLHNYYVIENGDYVYNPRISASAPVGPISKNYIGQGVMSPLYTIFRFHNSNNEFYNHYFKTKYWHKYLKNVANQGARFDRMNITTDDFMNMPIPASCPEEQQKIADCLSSVDDLITAQTDRLEALKNHKKGLMQQLFPNINDLKHE